MEQVCIWDASALTDQVHYNNCGNWLYEEQPIPFQEHYDPLLNKVIESGLVFFDRNDRFFVK